MAEAVTAHRHVLIMFYVLIDTCVWLDLAKDHRQQSLLSVLEELIRQNKVCLILPRTVVDEFERNKSRIAEESCRSLSSVLKRVKEVVSKFGDGKGKQIALNQLNDVDHIAEHFSRIKSLYSISLAETLERVQPALVSDLMIEEEWMQEPRRLTEILEAMDELVDKIWYNRHQLLRHSVETGRIRLIDKKDWSIENNSRTIVKEIWVGARKAAKRAEKKYGAKNLGPWTDFEWGMLNGKLSALRWTLGDEWDMLDT
jgi:hypothetical protein